MKKLLPILLLTSLFAREYIAIIDFEGISVSEADAKALTQRLTSEMIALEMYQVLERSEMKKLLEEQKFQYSGCVDMKCAVEIGKMLGAKYMVVGSISKVGSTYSIDSRLIDVETSESYYSGSYSHTGTIDRLIYEGMKSIAHQLSDLPFDIIQKENNITRQIENNESSTDFEYFEYFENGLLALAGENYTDNIKNGLWVRYHNPWKADPLKRKYHKVEETNYKNGKKHGREKFYYETGEINTIKNYRDGILHGENITFSKNGQIVYETNYIMGLDMSEERKKLTSFQQKLEDISYVDPEQQAFHDLTDSLRRLEKINQKQFSTLSNNLLLNSNDFLPKNKIRETTRIVKIFEPYSITITTLHETKLNIMKINDGRITELINAVVPSGEEFKFDFESTINFEFWSNSHVLVKLNDKIMERYIDNDNLGIRGSYEADKSQLYLGFYKHVD